MWPVQYGQLTIGFLYTSKQFPINWWCASSLILSYILTSGLVATDTACQAVTRFLPLLQTTMFFYTSNLLILFKSNLIICHLSFIIWFSRKKTTFTGNAKPLVLELVSYTSIQLHCLGLQRGQLRGSVSNPVVLRCALVVQRVQLRLLCRSGNLVLFDALGLTKTTAKTMAKKT
jgi:hypothetical protein